MLQGLCMVSSPIDVKEDDDQSMLQTSLSATSAKQLEYINSIVADDELSDIIMKKSTSHASNRNNIASTGSGSIRVTPNGSSESTSSKKSS